MAVVICIAINVAFPNMVLAAARVQFSRIVNVTVALSFPMRAQNTLILFEAGESHPIRASLKI